MPKPTTMSDSVHEFSTIRPTDVHPEVEWLVRGALLEGFDVLRADYDPGGGIANTGLFDARSPAAKHWPSRHSGSGRPVDGNFQFLAKFSEEVTP